MKMKILQVPTYVVYGGMSMHVLTLAAGLKRHGHEVEVLSMCPGPLSVEFEKADIPLSVVPHLEQRAGRNPLLMAKVIKNVRRYIREREPDIVHTHGPRAHFFAGIAAGDPGSGRLVASAHGSYTQFTVGQTGELNGAQRQLKKVIYGGIDRMTARKAERMIAVSDATRNDLVSGLGISDSKVTVVRNGIEEVMVDEAEKTAIREEFRFGEDDRVVACVGRIAYHKGSAVLADAMKIVCAQTPRARFLVVGEGPMENELRQMAGQDGLAGRVHVTGRRVDAIAIIATADVLVMPSFSEGLPITLLEAAMSGTAMVATDIGGMPEVVRDGETGLVCQPGDPEGLASSIIRLVEDDTLRRNMGAEARALWEKEFTEEVMVRRMETVYRDVCERRVRS